MDHKESAGYINSLISILSQLVIQDIDCLLNLLLDAYKNNRQIFVFGNGGSAATSSHFACDLNKGVVSGFKKRFKVICLNNSIAISTAYANDVSFEDIFVEQLKNFIKDKDLVIGISTSGNSKNVLKAIQYANQRKAFTFGLTGYAGGELVKLAKNSLVVESYDTQKIEDVHLIITHMIMQRLKGAISK
jgi:D-sedoheptulose 7-phosphate isomerase